MGGWGGGVCPHPEPWCWGQWWHLAHPSCAQKRFSDPVIDSISFTTPECGRQAPCHEAIPPYVLRFAHFYLHSTPPNPATPECPRHFPVNAPLLLVDVVCWDCPSLPLSVPAKFKDHFFLKDCAPTKIDVPTPLSLSHSLVILFYALIPFGYGYITIIPLYVSFPQHVSALHGRGHLSFMFTTPTPHLGFVKQFPFLGGEGWYFYTTFSFWDTCITLCWGRHHFP